MRAVTQPHRLPHWWLHKLLAPLGFNKSEVWWEKLVMRRHDLSPLLSLLYSSMRQVGFLYGSLLAPSSSASWWLTNTVSWQSTKILKPCVKLYVLFFSSLSSQQWKWQTKHLIPLAYILNYDNVKFYICTFS